MVAKMSSVSNPRLMNLSTSSPEVFAMGVLTPHFIGQIQRELQIFLDEMQIKRGCELVARCTAV